MAGVNGLEMLVAQALYAVEFFLDVKLDEAKIDAGGIYGCHNRLWGGDSGGRYSAYF